MRIHTGPCLALLVALLVLLAPASALAQASDVDKATAQVLFNEARELLDQRQYEKACEKLAESQRLDPALGTQLNLADCYEKLGKSASAWLLFMEAGAAARDAGQQKRADVARQRARALEKRLSTLSVSVTMPVDGLVVTRNGEVLREVVWGNDIPVDPGKYEIVAKAPGMETWRKEVTVKGNGDRVKIDVPVLDEDLSPRPAEEPPAPPAAAKRRAPASPPPAPEPAPDDDGGSSGLVVTGAVTGALGLGGVVAGSVLAAMAKSNNDASLDECSAADVTLCNAEGVQLRADAINAQTGAIVAYAAGGAVAAAGVIMLVVGVTSDDTASDAVAVVPAPDGAAVRWRW